MRVLNLVRPSGPTGGDIGTALDYANALQGLNADIQVDVRPANELDGLDDYDFIHMWAACSPDWGLEAAKAARQSKAKFILSPIWWPRDARQAFYGMPGIDIAPGYRQSVAAIINMADVLVCFTMSELVECWKLVPNANGVVMGIGIDRRAQKAQPPDDYVLSIGRVERHKNQWWLALACRMLGYKLKCAGTVRDEEYAEGIRQQGAEILGEIPHDDLIDKYLARARVHALPSFGEVVSRANCEAYDLGIPSVISLEGADPEYFGDWGYYCRPEDWRSIQEALRRAWFGKRLNWGNIIHPTWVDVARNMYIRMREWNESPFV